MKLRVIEDAAGRFVVQSESSFAEGYWRDGTPGDFFKTAEEACYEMGKRLENHRRAEQDKQVKRVIAEGDA
jgi:hypothetical protein